MSVWKQTLKQTSMRAGTLLEGIGMAGSVRTSISDVRKDKHGQDTSGLVAARLAAGRVGVQTQSQDQIAFWAVSDTIFERRFF